MLGYGFPLEDLHARYLLADGIARRAREQILRISLFQTPERRGRLFLELVEGNSLVAHHDAALALLQAR